MARSDSAANWKIPGYVAEQLIGGGASAQVWRGRTTRTGEPVALKVLRATDNASYRAARSEAALLSALDHPHLIRLHEMVADGDRAVLVLDLAEGGSLAEVLHRRSRLTTGEVVTALSPIAAALAYAHEQGLVHADVSPANILFTSAGQPMLADLGTAQLFGAAEDNRATLAYLDPVIAAGGAPGPPSDVFMVAAVALHALSGRPPWTGTTGAALIADAANGEIANLDRLLTDVPDEVAAVVRRGLSVVPHARGSAAAFALDLRAAAPPAPVELAAGRGRAVLPALDPGRRQAGSPAPAQPIATGYRPRHSGSAAVSDRRSTGPATAAGTVVPAVLGPEFSYLLDRPDFSRPHVGGPGAAVLRESGLRESGRRGRGWRESGPQESGDGAHDTDIESAALSLTHQVRARARPAPPPRRTFGRRPRVVSAAVLAALLAVAMVAAIALGRIPIGRRSSGEGVQSTPSGDSPAPPATAVARADAATAVTAAALSVTAAAAASAAKTPARTASAPPRAATASAAGAGVTPVGAPSERPAPTGALAVPPKPAAPDRGDPAAWAATLRRLDAHRERAFATADPAELSQVYVAGSLLQQDVAALHRVVGPGCVLTHLRTSYRIEQVTLSASAVQLSTRASLSAAQLECAGAAPRQSPARADGPLSIRLIPTAAGYRIGSLTTGQ